jgi:Cysteine sulfinate desulfinase/cysteine desulfurase and related enzymes
MHPQVYLDHNATTPVRPEAVAAAATAFTVAGNPSSIHRAGRTARRLIEDAREQVALLVDVDPSWVVFTSGGTEANALALTATQPASVLVSAVEHASVREAAAVAGRLPVDGEGSLDLPAAASLLQSMPQRSLVSVMLANNETGVVQPVAAVAEIARTYGAIVHCDAVQAAGKMSISLRTLGVHLLSLSAHKLGGPPGVGALVVDPALPFTPLLRGGGQERRRRAGTENLPGIAGFGAAAAVAQHLTDTNRLARLRDRIEHAITTRCPTARIFGRDAPRLPNTSCIAMPGVDAETQVIGFDLAGIAVSAGAACSSGKVGTSHVLQAMGVGEDLAGCSVRVSLGWTTTDDDADRFVAVWQDVYHRSNRTGRTGLPLATDARPKLATIAVSS